MIKSRFAVGNVYFPFLCLLLLQVLGVFLIRHLLGQVDEGSVSAAGAWVPGSIAISMSGWFLYILLKKMVLVHISPDRVELRSLFFRKTIYKQEIDAIDLSARADMGAFGGNRRGGAITIASAGTGKYILPDIFYQNAPAMKRALQEYFLSGDARAVSFSPEYTGSREPVPPEEEREAEKFSGNAILSINGIMFLAGVLIVLFASLTAHRHWLSVWSTLLIVSAFYYLFVGTQMFYFKLSHDLLIVKNQLFPWYIRGYRLDAIKDIVFESPYKRSNALRVTMKDFTSKAFPAGSLREDTWKALKIRLEESGIPVRNEL